MEALDYYSPLEQRTLHENAVIFSVPQNIYGDRIKEGSVELEVAGRTIEEDGYGNLYDSTRKSLVGSLIEITNSKLVSHISFNEGYRYVNTVIDSGSLRALPYTPFQPGFKNIQFADGTYGKKAEFQGEGSQVVIPYSKKFDFNYGNDFFISMMLDVPASQTYLTDSTNVIIKNGAPTSSSGPYPFSLEVYNTGVNEGKLALKRYDGQMTTTIVSSTAVNDGIARHIGLRKSGSLMQLWIDGAVDNSSTNIGSGDILNNDNVYVGYNFTGGIDELKIFKDCFSTTDVTNYALYESGSNLNYNVDNVFYETGMVVITSPYAEFAALAENTGSYTFEARGTREIQEYEIICQIEGNEFNTTVNPSSATLAENGQMAYNDNIRSDHFSPYVSQLGLYNDAGDLLLIAKPSQPIKIPNNTDLTFVVRFDT